MKVVVYMDGGPATVQYWGARGHDEIESRNHAQCVVRKACAGYRRRRVWRPMLIEEVTSIEKRGLSI